MLEVPRSNNLERMGDGMDGMEMGQRMGEREK